MAKSSAKTDSVATLAIAVTYVVYCESNDQLWKNSLGEVFHTSNETLARVQAYEVTRASMYSFKAIPLNEWAIHRLEPVQSN